MAQNSQNLKNPNNFRLKGPIYVISSLLGQVFDTTEVDINHGHTHVTNGHGYDGHFGPKCLKIVNFDHFGHHSHLKW